MEFLNVTIPSKIKAPKLFTTVVQKPNQGTIRNHGVADCWAFFWYFFGQTKKYIHNQAL
jgi:hypothetical protein